MAKINAQPQVTRQAPCPGCGSMANYKSYMKDGHHFQLIDCLSCQSSFGKLKDGTDSWHLLGKIDSRGHLIGPVFSKVKE